MKTFAKLLGIAAAVCAAWTGLLQAAPVIGQEAPDFTLRDVTGKLHTLSSYRGKTVVLEWVNPECPFVVKHYSSFNLPNLQKEATGDGVVWLAINSGRPGAQGDFNPAQVSAWLK